MDKSMRQLLSFNEVLLPEGEVPAIKREGGKCFLCIKAPEAKSVSFIWDDIGHDCTCENGVWSVEYTPTEPNKYVQLLIDGARVITPLLPIGYGYSRPYNYVENEPEDAFYALRDVPHGTLRQELYFSRVTGEWQRLTVYTPPGYDEETGKIFPVLYLQHGHGENEVAWSTAGRVNLILDNLIAEGKAEPFAVVMSCGMVQLETENGRVVDFHLFERELFEDIIPFIEKKLRIGGKKELRAMAGLSMGSLQTCMCGFARPEMFSALGVFSGFVSDIITGSPLDRPGRGLGDNAHLKILDAKKTFSENFHPFFRAMGDRDQFLDTFRHDDKMLAEKGIEHIRKIYPGAHDWNVWRPCIRDFAQMIFR